MAVVESGQWGLPPEAVARIRGVLAAYPEIERVMLFGSRAKGNFQPGSDIDLAIMGAALSVERLALLETRLDDLLLPWRIDVVPWERIDNPALTTHIQRVGQVFCER